MCGLTGYVDLQTHSKTPQKVLLHMNETLVHRGPDSAGFFVEANVGLAFRRLSIVDLEGGHQPLFNEDRSIVVICNGEIYNYKSLRCGLVRAGHQFSTNTDVEVLVHLYEQEGTEFLNQLSGQFAFVLYDRIRETVFIARDHFGINPLFYTLAEGSFVFASEIKAILAHPLVRREVDLTGLDQILSLPGLVSPRTMFKGISSLKPGHYITIHEGNINIREYWDLRYPRIDEITYASDTIEYVEALRCRLEESTKRRLQADVPVGLYLSGGLDSSVIAALAAKISADARRHSFSVCFADGEMSEQTHQRAMAKWIDSIHHEIVVTGSDICDSFRSMIRHCECPVKESYNTCSMALSKIARSAGVKAVLAGEGADELFAGYIGYRFDGSSLRKKQLADLTDILEAQSNETLWGDPRLLYEIGCLALRDTKAALYSRAVQTQLADFDCFNFSLVNKERIQGRHLLHQRSYLDFKLRLADHLVGDHGDRMGLANAVEVRYPFLDLDLVEYVTRIPPKLKLKGLQEKYILKKAAEGLVPSEIIEREKFGFHGPSSPHLLNENVSWIADLLAPELIAKQGYFDVRTVQRLKQQYIRPGFRLNPTFENDLLMVVLSFGVFLQDFKMPYVN